MPCAPIYTPQPAMQCMAMQGLLLQPPLPLPIIPSVCVRVCFLVSFRDPAARRMVCNAAAQPGTLLIGVDGERFKERCLPGRPLQAKCNQRHAVWCEAGGRVAAAGGHLRRTCQCLASNIISVSQSDGCPRRVWERSERTRAVRASLLVLWRAAGNPSACPYV